MFALIAFVLGIIAAVLAWYGNVHAEAFIYAAIAFIALHLVFPFSSMFGPGRRAV